MPYFDYFDEIDRMRKRMQKAMRGFFLPVEEDFGEDTFPVDMLENKDEDELIVKADLPGFNKEDVAIKVTENTVEIAAQHKEKRIEKTEKMFRAERSFGGVKRYLTLPEEVKPETAKAEMNNGVLEIRMEKVQKKKKAREVKVE